GAFVVIIAVENVGVAPTIGGFAGLGRRAPWTAAAMAVFLFSLTGLPPLAGFFGKFYLFYALLARGGSFMVTLALVGILNSALSLYFYARVLKAMYFEPAETGSGHEQPLTIARVHGGLLAVLALPTLALFLCWSP